VEGGPQNEDVVSNSSKQLEKANSLRITRDGGAVMLQMQTTWDYDDCDLVGTSDTIRFVGEDGDGNSCFNEAVGRYGDSNTGNSRVTCSGRDLTLTYDPPSDMSGGGNGQVVLTGTNWN